MLRMLILFDERLVKSAIGFQKRMFLAGTGTLI